MAQRVGGGLLLTQVVACDATQTPLYAGLAVGTAAAAGGIYWAVQRLLEWKARQVPAGMVDIQPNQLEAFFQRHVTEEIPVRDLLLGFCGSNSLPDVLRNSLLIIAAEIEELTRTHDLLPETDVQGRLLARGAVEAYYDLQAFMSLRLGETVRTRVAFLHRTEAIYQTLKNRLSTLQEYRTRLIENYLREGYARENGADPAIVAHYNDKSPDQQWRRREEVNAVLRMWQKLPIEEREVMWEFHDARSAAVPPAFLRLFAETRHRLSATYRSVPHLNEEVMMSLRGHIQKLLRGPELPWHLKSNDAELVLFRDGVRRMGRLKAILRAGRHQIHFVDAGSGQKGIFTSEEILTTRGRNYNFEQFAAEWKHPDIQSPQVKDLDVFPSLSLEEGEKFIVDYSDPRIIHFLSQLKQVRTNLDRKVLDRQFVALEIWKKLAIDPVDVSVIRSLHTKGQIRHLFDLLNNKAVKERAVLMQLAFQYLGIPSRLERGEVTLPEGTEKRYWVRVSLPGHPEYFLCTDLKQVIEAGHSNAKGFVNEMTPPPAAAQPPQAAVGEPKTDDTPLPTPLPPPPDDEEVTKMFPRNPAPQPADDEEPTKVMATPTPSPKPVPPPAAGVEDSAARRFREVDEKRSATIKADLAAELRDRYRDFLGNDSEGAKDMVRKLSERIYEKWKELNFPAMEFDEQGIPTRVPETVFETIIERWLNRLEKESSQVAQQIVQGMRGAGDRGGRAKRGTSVLTPPPGPAPVAPPPLPDKETAAKLVLRSYILDLYSIFEDPSFTGMLNTLAGLTYRIWVSQPSTETVQPQIAQTFIDQAVDRILPALEKAPEGSDGHRLLVSIRAAREAAAQPPKVAAQPPTPVPQPLAPNAGEEAAKPKSVPPQAAAPVAAPEEVPEDERPTAIPPPPAPPAAAASKAATPPDTSHVRTRPTTPPQPPRPSAETVEKRTIAAGIQERYPAFRQPQFNGLLTILINQLQAKKWSGVEEAVQRLAPALEKSPEGSDGRLLLQAIRVSDAIAEELRDRYRAFRENPWASQIPAAVGAIYARWETATHQEISVGPEGQKAIAENIFDEGYDDFVATLQEKFPKVSDEVLFDHFRGDDAGPRAHRWRDPKDLQAGIAAQISEIYPVLEGSAQASTLKALTQSVHRAWKTAESRRTESGPRGQLRVADSIVQGVLSRFIKTLADTARPGSGADSILQALLQSDIASEIRQQYTALRDPSFNALVTAQARAIYRLWDQNNRTFNGSADVLPLRIPEKFVSQGLTSFFSQLRQKAAKDENIRKLLGQILTSYRGDRATRAKNEKAPLALPQSSPIAISEETVALELGDRFRLLGQSSHRKLARDMARDIYKMWLAGDPTRDMEKSGPGLRGLIPESVLESGIQEFYSKLEKAKLGSFARQIHQSDRGLRNERGTAILEYDITQHQRRKAA